MAAGYGTALLAHDVAKYGIENVLPGCTAGDLSMDVSEYRRFLTGTNGAHVVGLFKVAVDAHLSSGRVHNQDTPTLLVFHNMFEDTVGQCPLYASVCLYLVACF